MVHEHAPSDGAELQAARATILLLRAALPGGDTVRQLQIHPDGEIESSEQAARRLAVMAKPLHCQGHVVGPLLEIVCDEASPEDESAELMRRSSPIRMALSRAESTDAPGILLIGAGESVLLSRSALEEWTRDYAIDVRYGMSGDDPTPGQRVQGIRWVIEFGPGAVSTMSVDDLDLPEPLRSTIAEEFKRAVREHQGVNGETP